MALRLSATRLLEGMARSSSKIYCILVCHTHAYRLAWFQYLHVSHTVRFDVGSLR